VQVTIASLSDANKNERIDSQFFRPEYVTSYKVVVSNSNDTLSEIAHITDGNHLKIAENFDDAKGVRYLRGQDLSADMMLHDRNIVYIPESCFDSLKRSHIHKYDILITIVGANTGLVGLVYDPPKMLVANCKLGIARVDKNQILPGYLYAFLIGRFGQHQLLRSIRGGGQTGLILPDLRQLRITRLTQEFEVIISDLVLSGHSKVTESKNVYQQAQVILLGELGLSNWQPKHKSSFVKRYSDVQQAKRMDAEFFEPKYDEILFRIKATGQSVALGTLLSKIQRGKQPSYSETGLPVINSKHVVHGEARVDADNRLATQGARDVSIRSGDVLINGTGVGTIGRCAPYLRVAEVLPDNHVTILRPSDESIDPVYLSVFLNSIAGQSQVEQWFRGSSGQIELYPDDIAKFTIWQAPDAVQATIRSHIEDSFKAKADADHLLEYAKRAVEIAIEQDEESAMQWLELQTREQSGYHEY